MAEVSHEDKLFFNFFKLFFYNQDKTKKKNLQYTSHKQLLKLIRFHE